MAGKRILMLISMRKHWILSLCLSFEPSLWTCSRRTHMPLSMAKRPSRPETINYRTSARAYESVLALASYGGSCRAFFDLFEGSSRSCRKIYLRKSPSWLVRLYLWTARNTHRKVRLGNIEKTERANACFLTERNGKKMLRITRSTQTTNDLAGKRTKRSSVGSCTHGKRKTFFSHLTKVVLTRRTQVV